MDAGAKNKDLPVMAACEAKKSCRKPSANVHYQTPDLRDLIRDCQGPRKA